MGASKSVQVMQGTIRDGKYYDDSDQLVRNTKGKFQGQNGYIYEGQISSGKKQGFGRETKSDLEVYEGAWDNDMKHGRGRMSNKYGETYEGYWKKNLRHGDEAFYSYENENYYITYFLKWQNDKPTCQTRHRQDGSIIYLFPNKQFQTPSKQFQQGRKFVWIYSSGGIIQYVGEIQGTEMHGNGTLFEIDGSCYKGQFKENKMHGNGTFYEKDGSFYKGKFNENKMHGLGTFYEKDGTFHEGNWIDGQKQDLITTTHPDGSKEYYVWKNGIRGYKLLTKKIILLGDDSVGKSSLINSFIKNECTKIIAPTIGIIHHTKQYIIESLLYDISLEIYDTCGSFDYTNNKEFIQTADVILLVFDSTRQKQTLSSLNKYIDFTEEICTDKVVKILVGHKCDSPQDYTQIDPAVDSGLECCFTSTLNNESIQTLFKYAVNQSLKAY